MPALDQHRLAIFEDDATTPNAKEFRARVRLLMVRAAIAIQGEAKTTLTPQQWQKRAKLAYEVTSDSSRWLDTFALACAATEAVGRAVPDEAIEARIAAVWDALAGVSGEDK